MVLFCVFEVKTPRPPFILSESFRERERLERERLEREREQLVCFIDIHVYISTIKS